VVARKLLDHTLGLVQRQELGNADANEGGQVRVLELRVHLTDRSAQRLHLLQKLVQVLSTGAAAITQKGVQHRPKLVRELGELGQSFLKDGGELQEAERVACRRSVEHNDIVGHGLDLLQDLCEGHGFIDTGYLRKLADLIRDRSIM